MNDWMILGIEKTDDLRKVKHAYAKKTKLYHPEIHPDEFQKLHNAYKRIVAEIRRNADSSQQIQVPMPKIVPVPEKQVVVVHKPERDIKQDEDFLKLVEDAAEHFEERHTDKRDPAQVAKVEYILQHDVRNSKLLEQFQRLLHNEFFAEGWREFFINEEFLERQYEPEFINGMTEILKSRLLERQRIVKAKKCSLGIGVMVYYIIVYGDIFEGIEHVQFDKKIYRKDLLQGMANMFLLNEDKRDAYLLVEQRKELLGERYAFSLYRRILEELDADRPAKDKIMEVLQEGFQREGISKVYFDLLLYLMTSNRKNISLFRLALLQTCEMEWDNSIREEIEILKLELGELQVEENIEQETHTTDIQTIKGQTVDVQEKEMLTKEQRLAQREEEEEKSNRSIGKWLFRIAVIILCLNAFCRIVDAGKSTKYVQTTGIVTFVSGSSEWHAGKRSYSYRVYVDYETRGWWGTLSTDETYSSHKFSKGDTVPVLYRKDNVFEAYIAKKDWMTGAYLPASKWYNVPFVISVVLFIFGFLFYTNSPILEWLEHADEITIGKKKSGNSKPIKKENSKAKRSFLMKLLKCEILQECQMKRGIILYAFIVSILLICTIVIGNFAYKEVCDAQMLGKVSLHPVKFKEELNTRKEGDTTYVTGRTYYIIYEYQWDGKQENVRLKCDEIYSQNDRETAKAAINNQEIIERTIYLDNFRKRHFSECETTKAFQHKHVRTALIPCVIISVIILFPGILWLIIYLAKKREISLLQSQRPNAIICTGVSFIICFFLEVGLIIVVMGICMLAGLASDPLEAVVCGVLIISMGLGLITFLFMQIWNRRVVLDKEEVLFKNAFGKEKRYSKTEITQCRTLNYSVYNGSGFIRRRNFYIHVGKEIIALNDCMTNYYEAIDFAKQNYMCEDSIQN